MKKNRHFSFILRFRKMYDQTIKLLYLLVFMINEQV